MRSRCLTFAVKEEDALLWYLWHVIDAFDQDSVPLLGVRQRHLIILVAECEYQGTCLRAYFFDNLPKHRYVVGIISLRSN